MPAITVMQILRLCLLSPLLHFLAEFAAVWRLKLRAKRVEGITMSKAAFLHSSVQRICPSSVLFYFLHLSGGESGGGLFFTCGKIHMLRVNILAYQKGSLQQQRASSAAPFCWRRADQMPWGTAVFIIFMKRLQKKS